MKKYFSLLIFLIGTSVIAGAQQASTTLIISSATKCTNEEVCIDFSVDDYTDVVYTEFTIQWDSSVLQFLRIQDITLAGLTQGNFDISRAANGFIKVKREGTCAPGAGTTHPDASIFKICFKATADYGAYTSISLVDEPGNRPIIRKDVTCSQNINSGLVGIAGTFSTCVRPVEIFATNEQNNTGELVCIEFKSKGFDQLTSLQFSVNWDPAFLEFEEVIPSEILPNLAVSSFGTPDLPNVGPGNLTVSWAYIPPDGQPGITLADSSTIFTVCYRVRAACDKKTTVNFSSAPTRTEVTNTVREGFKLYFIGTPGEVNSGKCSSAGLQLFTDCGGALNYGDEICVKVMANGLKDLSHLEYLMRWNPGILKYKSVKSFNTTIPAFGKTHFNETNTDNGILALAYQRPGPQLFTVPNGAVLYEVCFEVIGLGGNSPFSFPLDPAVVRVNNGPNIGINPKGCEIIVNQPSGVVINMPARSIPLGDSVCMDLTVSNFTQIDSMQFSVIWDPELFQFERITNVTLPQASAGLGGNFDISGKDGGIMLFEWNPTGPQTLANGSRIFSLCYTAVGLPDSCGNIFISDNPLEATAYSAVTGPNNIMEPPTGGEICILYPDGFSVHLPKVEGDAFAEICVPVKVTRFTDITSANFFIGWDPTQLKFVKAEPTGSLPGSSFNTANVASGALGLTWSSGTGITLADSTVIYNLCFQLIGKAGECSKIGLNDNPAPTTTLTTGNGSVLGTSGEVCINNRLIIKEIIVEGVKCDGNTDGRIRVVATTGNGDPVSFNLTSGSDQQFSAVQDGSDFVGDFRNLHEGMATLVAFNPFDPNLLIDTIIMVGRSDSIPVANAGPDRPFTCNPAIVRLDGAGSTGNAYDYSWTSIGGRVENPSDAKSVLVKVPGQYILHVTNKNTGCTKTDTMTLTPIDLPVAKAGRDTSMDCRVNSIQLNASLSSTGDTVKYVWVALDGGSIMPGESMLINPTVTTPGKYELQVLFDQSGCSAFDTLEVKNARFTPKTDAGADTRLACDGTGAVLVGKELSADPRAFAFTWLSKTGDLLSNSNQFTATAEGEYILSIEDQESGCVAKDSVVVGPVSTVVLNVALGDDQVIGCQADTLTLQPIIENSSNFKFRWIALGSGVFVEGTESLLNARVSNSGTFAIMVTDTTTNCSATDTIGITLSNEPPVADAGLNGTITCQDTLVTLHGGASSIGESIQYMWKNSAGDVLGTDSTVVVGEEGRYFLEVFDAATGCSNIDSVKIELLGERPDLEGQFFQTLTCENDTLALDFSINPLGPNYTVQWKIKANTGGNFVTDDNTNKLFSFVNKSGTYEVYVLDTISKCDALAEFIVTEDKTIPTADAGKDEFIGCDQDSVLLGGDGTAIGGDITYLWRKTDVGFPLEDFNKIKANVKEAGTYVLLALDTTNGCFALDTAMVTKDTLPPVIDFGAIQNLDCQNKTIVIDAGASQVLPGYTARWVLVDDGSEIAVDTLMLTVDAPGMYALSITNPSGCEKSDTVEIKELSEVPQAIVENELIEIQCNNKSILLDGSMSSTGQGIIYKWTTLSGSGKISNAAIAAPNVDGPGEYQLVVTNTAGNCSDTAMVVISLAGGLENALVSEDSISTCDSTAMLFANAPANATGTWKAVNSGTLEMPASASTFVSGISVPQAAFVWTLSTTECPNYSSDTLFVFNAVAPKANPDNLILNPGDSLGTIDLLLNDNIKGLQNWEIRIETNPANGQAAILGSLLTYKFNTGFAGSDDEFRYKVCSVDCPNLCSTSLVRVSTEKVVVEIPDGLPNAITPNGDGQNDALVFDILLENPNAFPDNEIVIFNRWGDMVFKSKPYMNNWQGNNQNGDELPHGTYYYILRLDISESVILKGDVTVVK